MTTPHFLKIFIIIKILFVPFLEVQLSNIYLRFLKQEIKSKPCTLRHQPVFYKAFIGKKASSPKHNRFPRHYAPLKQNVTRKIFI